LKFINFLYAKYQDLITFTVSGLSRSIPLLLKVHSFIRSKAGFFVVLFIVGGSGGLVFNYFFRKPTVTPVMRGFEIASRVGCFLCHGQGGLVGTGNAGSDLGFVPPFTSAGPTMYYVQSEQEVREWILDGIPKRLKSEQQSNAKIDTNEVGAYARNCQTGVIKMPAFKPYLSSREVDDLVAYFFAASSWHQPVPEDAARGKKVAEKNGCFGCHGPNGQGGFLNPGSFKGYIPPWDSPDYHELVENDNELHSWISNGMVERFEKNPAARFFFSRMAIKMPSFKEVILTNDFEDLTAYVRWMSDKKRISKTDWVEKNAPTRMSRVEYGRWLYKQSGCVSCHGPDGKGGVPNHNYVSKTVPPLNYIAESMELFEKADADALVSLFERGIRLSEVAKHPPIDNFEFVYRQYESLKSMILRGGYSARKDSSGLRPPMNMPAWEHRMNATKGPFSDADVDAIIAYLLTLQQW
jgi:mono/diheme cytochrome c family protein